MTDRADPKPVDWTVATWEGSRREQLERWASMSLDEILQAQEEMADLSQDLARQAGDATPDPGTHQAGSPPTNADPLVSRRPLALKEAVALPDPLSQPGAAKPQ